MIVTRTTTALMLAMSLLVAAGLTVVAVKVFADDTIVQASDQKIKPSNSGQINQAGDGDGDRTGSIDQENNAANLDRQEVNIGDNNDDNTILQLSGQEIEPSNAALINQAGDGDGDWFAEIDQINNAENDHCQKAGEFQQCLTTPPPP